MSRVALAPIYNVYWSLRHGRVVSTADQAVETKHSHIDCKAKKWIRESIAWRQNTKNTNTRNRREGNAVRQVGTWSVGGLPSGTQPQVGSSTSVGDLTFWHWHIGGWHTWHSLRAGDAYSMMQSQGFELLLLLALQIFRRNVCKQIHFTQLWNIYPHRCVYFISLNWHWWHDSTLGPNRKYHR